MQNNLFDDSGCFNKVLMCKIGEKYQYASLKVCTYAYVLESSQGVRLLEHVR